MHLLVEMRTDHSAHEVIHSVQAMELEREPGLGEEVITEDDDFLMAAVLRINGFKKKELERMQLQEMISYLN